MIRRRVLGGWGLVVGLLGVVCVKAVEPASRIVLDFSEDRFPRDFARKLERAVTIEFEQTPFKVIVAALQEKLKVPIVLQVGQERFNRPIAVRIKDAPAWLALHVLCARVDAAMRFAESAVFLECPTDGGAAPGLVFSTPHPGAEGQGRREPHLRVRFADGTEISMESEDLLKRNGLTEMLLARALPETTPAPCTFVGKLQKEWVEDEMLERLKKAIAMVAPQAPVVVDQRLGLLLVKLENPMALGRVETLMDALGIGRTGREVAGREGAVRLSGKIPLAAPSGQAGEPVAGTLANDPLPPEVPARAIHIDGSSTVFPLAMAAKRLFLERYPQARVLITGEGQGETPAGSGGGFRKFLAGEIEVANASRPMKEKERKEASEKGISFLELPLAYDGLSVAVSARNHWCDHLTIQELQAMWSPGSKVSNWKEVRHGFPDQPLRLFGPGGDSGTYEYFTEVIVGKANASRMDFTASEDDEVLVRGIVGDPNALGFFGLAYVKKYKDEIKVLGIDRGQGPVWPSAETVGNGTYRPLARPLFVYVKAAALSKPEVAAWVAFFLRRSSELAIAVGYVPLSEAMNKLVWDRFLARTPGPFPFLADAEKR